MRKVIAITALSLALAACNQNTAVGNDREAQVEPAPTPAPIENAATALRNVSTAIIKPETMSNADIQALGGKQGRCEVILTEVAFPSFLYEPSGQGAIKLNGTLIPLTSTGPNRFSDGELTVQLNLLDEEGNAGSQGMQMIVVPPGAEDEIGYNGYVRCHDGAEP
jgi:hypothetical protein|tara:strand:+ start:20447 stop:20941 length:495 start_codon:yes stop_codon:yes gene_type:complete